MTVRAGPVRPASWVLAPLAALCAACARPAEKSEESPPAAAIETAKVLRGPLEESLRTIGAVTFDPARVRTLTLTAGGQVLQVPVVAGQVVRRGDLLLALGPPPADSVDVEHARTDVDFAEKELARARRLLEEKLATNQDVANAEKELDLAKATLRSLGEARSGGAAEVRAPADAVVVQVLVTSGQVTPAGREAVQIAPRGALAVAAGFETEDLPRLAAGAPVAIGPLYAADAERPVRAALPLLHRAVDPATQLVQALIVIADPPAWMAPGMKVDVHVTVRASADAVRVPRAALVERDGRTGVFVVSEGRAHWRPLTVGVVGENAVEALAGVTSGDVVATTGRSSLVDGMAVRTGPGQS